MMNSKMISKECNEDTFGDSGRSLAELINNLMISESCSVDRLIELTALSKATINKILSGDTFDMSVGIFLNILQALQCKINIEKNDVKYNVAEYSDLEKPGIMECPVCRQKGKLVASERANVQVKTTIEEKNTFLGKRLTVTESETGSFYSTLFLPPSSDKYGEKVFKVKMCVFRPYLITDSGRI